jgi:hypothetical protein
LLAHWATDVLAGLALGIVYRTLLALPDGLRGRGKGPVFPLENGFVINQHNRFWNLCRLALFTALGAGARQIVKATAEAVYV